MKDREIITALAVWAIVVPAAGLILSSVIWPLHPAPVAADVFPNESPRTALRVNPMEEAGG